jgi:hypothetical protein
MSGWRVGTCASICAAHPWVCQFPLPCHPGARARVPVSMGMGTFLMDGSALDEVHCGVARC